MKFYQVIGIFSLSIVLPTLAILGEGPDPDPGHVAERDVFFLLFSSKNPIVAQPIKLNDNTSLLASNFNSSLPTRIISHGWLLSPYSPIGVTIRNAYIQKGDFNVIVVDWSRGASAAYSISKKRLPFVGRILARFIDFLHQEGGMQFKDLYLIGYSFGAHVSGFAGKHVKMGRIPVIIGLDAAYREFINSTSGERLDASDADYVQLIHTNTGDWGIIEPTGHADFYPNYGYTQPSCAGLCAHERAFYYFAESINSNIGFWGAQCKDFRSFKQGFCITPATSTGPALMGGEPVQTYSTGVFFVPVKSAAPFAYGLLPGL